MKKTLTLLALLACALSVAAQVPTLHYGDSGYMYNPEWIGDSVIVRGNYAPMGVCSTPTFYGNAFLSGHGCAIHGVAFASNDFMDFPYLRIVVFQDRPLGNGVYAFDTVATELFCFVDSPAVSYANFEFVSTPPYTGRITAPLYNFYFRDAVTIKSGTRFYVGVCHSPYNVYNRSYYGKIDPDHYCPGASWNTVNFYSFRMPQGYDPSTYVGHDGQDSTWSLVLTSSSRTKQWATEDPMEKYRARGFLPILAPPDRSVRQNHIHDEPLTATVGNFHLARMRGDGHPVLAWDSVASDFGLAGADVDLYEVQYALYDDSYDSARSFITDSLSLTIPGPLVPEVYYKARIRCRNHHVCDIHDTLIWGPWSRDAYFRTDDTLPDCRMVEGFRFVGHRLHRPYFAWERLPEHTSFEIQCAPFDSNSWSSTLVEGRTSCVLPRGFRQAGTYKARIRALCRHQCEMHDTALWGPWSSPLVTFYDPGLWTEADTGEVGILATPAGPAFALNPNPTTGEVTVTLPPLGEGAVLTVADASGREVRRQPLDPAPAGSRLRLDLNGLPAGAYFVTLVTLQGSHTEKVLLN